MAWMRMSGQTWAGVAASFLGMWTVMMVAMMLPPLMPMLRRYRLAVDRSGQFRVGCLTTLVGLGYFAVWFVIGTGVFLAGVALAVLAPRYPAVASDAPIAAAMVVVAAGVFQFTAWKRSALARCSATPDRDCPPDAGTAWRHGVSLGVRCSSGCGNLMAILLVAGVMNPGPMLGVAAAINAERLAPASGHVARAIGIVIVATGIVMLARAAGLG